MFKLHMYNIVHEIIQNKVSYLCSLIIRSHPQVVSGSCEPGGYPANIG